LNFGKEHHHLSQRTGQRGNVYQHRDAVKIQLFPIHVDSFTLPGDDPPPDTLCRILEAENLSVENVSGMIGEDTFSLWRQDYALSKDTTNALQNLRFAIVHRYSSPNRTR
jgi:hypothetical protein